MTYVGLGAAATDARFMVGSCRPKRFGRSSAARAVDPSDCALPEPQGSVVEMVVEPSMSLHAGLELDETVPTRPALSPLLGLRLNWPCPGVPTDSTDEICEGVLPVAEAVPVVDGSVSARVVAVMTPVEDVPDDVVSLAPLVRAFP